MLDYYDRPEQKLMSIPTLMLRVLIIKLITERLSESEKLYKQ